jgi:hypothetical protein
MDNAIEKVKINIISYGFPDPGNLRSSKKKDVRMRIKTIVAMLKSH